MLHQDKRQFLRAAPLASQPPSPNAFDLPTLPEVPKLGDAGLYAQFFGIALTSAAAIFGWWDAGGFCVSMSLIETMQAGVSVDAGARATLATCAVPSLSGNLLSAAALPMLGAALGWAIFGDGTRDRDLVCLRKFHGLCRAFKWVLGLSPFTLDPRSGRTQIEPIFERLSDGSTRTAVACDRLNRRFVPLIACLLAFATRAFGVALILTWSGFAIFEWAYLQAQWSPVHPAANLPGAILLIAMGNVLAETPRKIREASSECAAYAASKGPVDRFLAEVDGRQVSDRQIAQLSAILRTLLERVRQMPE